MSRPRNDTDRFFIEQALYNSDHVLESLNALSPSRKRAALQLWEAFRKNLKDLVPPRLTAAQRRECDRLDLLKYGEQ